MVSQTRSPPVDLTTGGHTWDQTEEARGTGPASRIAGEGGKEGRGGEGM